MNDLTIGYPFYNISNCPRPHGCFEQYSISDSQGNAILVFNSFNTQMAKLLSVLYFYHDALSPDPYRNLYILAWSNLLFSL